MLISVTDSFVIINRPVDSKLPIGLLRNRYPGNITYVMIRVLGAESYFTAI